MLVCSKYFIFTVIYILLEVHFGLNTDLVIGREEGMVHGMGSVVLEDCSFHEKANLTEFDRDRVISIAAQDGEVCVTKSQTDI